MNSPTDFASPAPSGGNAAAWYLLLALVLGGVTWLISAHSLFVGDTDLWYHLSGGRFISETGRLPSTSFFSFLEPSRSFTDYYWLFQLLVFKLHSLFGYPALIFLRWLLYVSYVTLAWSFFREWTIERRAMGFALSAYVFLTVILIAGTRLINLRPHCFSYLCALIFIYILERRREKAWLLPLIALLWVNFHGITFPVLWVIALSYLAPLVWRRLRGGEFDREALLLAGCLTISMAMVWATPNGNDLLSVPFKFSKYSNEYIRELVRPDILDFLAPRFSLLTPKGTTAFTLYFVVAFSALVLSAKRGRLGLAQLCLFLGALFLVTRAIRFTVEFSILCLPLAAAAPRELFARRAEGKFAAKAVFALLVASLVFYEAYKTPPADAAVPRAGLPAGNVEFLKRVGSGGKVLNHPNSGGYLQWELYPKYKILMDMQIPFFFEDEDMFLISEASAKKNAFDGLAGKYRPEYVSVLFREEALLARLSESAEYAPVFFDDVGILFAERSLLPDIVAKYEIRETPLGERYGKSFKEMTKGKDKEKVKAELARVLSIWPGCGMANLWLAQAAMIEEDYNAALAHVEASESWFPNSLQVLAQKGDALQKLGRHQEALDSYARGMRFAEGSEKATVKRGMAYTYKAMNDPGKAYEYFSESLKVMQPATSAEDLWQFAMSAYLSGHEAEGVELARFAELRAEPGDSEPGNAIRKFLREIEVTPIQGGLKREDK